MYGCKEVVVGIPEKIFSLHIVIVFYNSLLCLLKTNLQSPHTAETDCVLPASTCHPVIVSSTSGCVGGGKGTDTTTTLPGSVSLFDYCFCESPSTTSQWVFWDLDKRAVKTLGN